MKKSLSRFISWLILRLLYFQKKSTSMSSEGLKRTCSEEKVFAAAISVITESARLTQNAISACDS
ncbi:MAG: hypothetical protein ACD_47C00221G0002 [uncultured bacterium]|nr:MAG: hypothetical protein ACD_47C00221G0002 [uncultured bacterium]